MRSDVEPEPGTRLYSAHLDRWVEYIGPGVLEGGARVDVGGCSPLDVSTTVPLVGLFETEHYPAQIGTHDAKGDRTHSMPGEVCAACSDADAGRWVPVSGCSIAWAVFEREGAYVWLT
jgi:hypothetical protein